MNEYVITKYDIFYTPSLRFLIHEVEEQRKLLLSVTRQIKKLSTSDRYACEVKLLKTIPGIGLITAMTLLTEMETFDRFQDTDHFAAFAGLVPYRHNSSETKKRRRNDFQRAGYLKKMYYRISMDSRS